MFEHLDDPNPPTGEDRRSAVRRQGLRPRATTRATRAAVLAAVVALAGGAALAGGLGDSPPNEHIAATDGPPSSVEANTTTSTTTTVASTTTTTAPLATTTTAEAEDLKTHCTQFPYSPGASAPDGIEVVLILDKTVFARSEPVTMTLRVRNNRGEAVTYDTGGGRNSPEWWVRDEKGNVVYDTSHERPFATTGTVKPYTIGPGEEREISTSWEQRHCAYVSFSPPFSLPPGRYVAQASWKPDWRAASVAFEIR